MNIKNNIFKFLLVSSILFVSFEIDAQAFRTIATVRNNQIDYIQIFEYNSVEVQPSFPGGNSAMMNFINSERVYPDQAYRSGVQGRVVCGFVVNVDGTISDISLMKGVEPSLDREAVRIISLMPRWNPGYYNSEPVPVYCVITIPFRL